jgi:hypothetical protein
MIAQVGFEGKHSVGASAELFKAFGDSDAVCL